MDKIELNIANVTKTSNLLHERITAQKQEQVSLRPDSSEYQGDDLGEEFRLVNMETDLTVGEVVTDQTETMSAGKCSLVAGLFNQNSPVPKTSGHLSSQFPSQTSHSLSS